MSDDIKELVKRLDEQWDRRRFSDSPFGEMSCLLADAADALEAMAGEVERLKVACRYDALNAGAIAEIRRACKEIMGSNASFVDDDFVVCLMTQKQRADAAEAERDRLKAALVEQVKQYPDYSDICRKALEAKE